MSTATDAGEPSLPKPAPRLARLGRLQLEHLPAVMAIEQRAYSHPWSEAIMRDCYKSGHDGTGLWLEDGRLLGYGWISCAVGEAHILNITIDPAVQGRGYGRRLLRRLLDVARWYRAEQVYLEVRMSNAVAAGLYRSMGFVEVGVRRGYYPAAGGREDARVMVLGLI